MPNRLYWEKQVEGKDVGQYGIEGFYFGDITGKEGHTYEEKIR